MDDLKLYASNSEQLKSELEIVKNFSKTIKMEFGLEKCAVLNVKKGKVDNKGETLLSDGTTIEHLKEEESYKYLGFKQALNIKTAEMKDYLKARLKQRLKAILSTQLNGRNAITAINCWVLPIITASFGVLKWSKTDMQTLDRLIRTTLTDYRSHHPKSSTSRLYISRNQEGRGLLNLEDAYEVQINKLMRHFKKHQHSLYRCISQVDKHFTALNLSEPSEEDISTNVNKRHVDEWRSKVLHGRFHATLTGDQVDHKNTGKYMAKGILDRETEGFIHAIQDQVIPTRNYAKHILKQNVTSELCRVCNKQIETIQHISSGCSSIAPREYLDRHNDIAKLIHSEICHLKKLSSSTTPYYKYTPQAVVENDNWKIYWDTSIITDKEITHNKPDILLIDKKQKIAQLIDIAVPLDDNLGKTYAEKINKYQDLSYELKRVYKLKKVQILPLIISCNGLIERRFMNNLQTLNLKNSLAGIAQKAAILGTCHIIRRYLVKD
ncbi:uncharacterized protein LOC115885612 [Sitophilus oryzae]|uniref:Uncharacterized protein LOC115885612 n=1 Tax=Sitophilus oryzae TaxID=7048 RepID=A0A6J2YB57_SITOR|nr:uncharacterized protein LOC115885612 [Sitophilus oryzae]